MVLGYNGKEFKLEDMQACVGKGWALLIEDLYHLCEQYNVTVLQVKEKFGSLRFYVGGAPDIVHHAIERAEKMSEMMCEECGEEGKIRSIHGWLYCSCEKHKRDEQ